MIGRFLTGTYQVTRLGKSFYKEGSYIPGSRETISVQGSLQPMNARELKMVSEGFRLHQLYKFYSDQPLLTINTKSLAGADVVEIDGDSYKVMSIEKWSGTDLPYFKSILQRQPEQ